MTKRQIIIVSCIVLTIGLIAWWVIYSITPRSTLQLTLAPEAGLISIDGGTKQAAKNGQTINVKPGRHHLEFSRAEFDSYSKDITVANRQTTEVTLVLNPLTTAARQLMITPGADLVTQRFAGEKMAKARAQLDKDYPILAVLPIQNRFYIINPCPSVKYPGDTTKIALCVDTTNQTGLEQYVNNDIKLRGFNPADYEIIYKIDPNPAD